MSLVAIENQNCTIKVYNMKIKNNFNFLFHQSKEKNCTTK